MSSPSPTPTPDTAVGLRRSLRPVDLVALGINAVIGTGIFFLPGYVAADLGPAAVLTFLLSAVLCSLLVLCFAEVSSRFQGTGGALLYSTAAFGSTVGFGVGWLGWIARLATWGALANALVDSLGTLVPGAPDQRATILTLIFLGFGIVNLAGVRQAALLTNVITVGKLLPLVLFIGVGLFFMDFSLLEPFAPHGYAPIGASTLVILFAFVGFETLPVPAGESLDPRRDMPRALILSMSIITSIYLLVWLVCATTLPTLAGSETPVSDAAAQFMGPVGLTVVNLGILLSVFGVNSATALITPRYLYALAERKTIPSVFGWLHANRRTPVVAILVTYTAAWLLAMTGTFVELAVLSVLARFGEYIPTCLALPRLRKLRPDDRGFRLPMGTPVSLLAVGVCVWLLTQAEPRQLVTGAVALGVGLLLHLPMRRRGDTDPGPDLR